MELMMDEQDPEYPSGTTLDPRDRKDRKSPSDKCPEAFDS